MHPRDSFSHVFFLFLFENESDEQLLQFLIAVVDTELLEWVSSEYLESVDIEHTDDRGRTVTWREYRITRGTVDLMR